MSENELRMVCKILTKHNLDYWLDSGTLLGISRDKKLIADDTDIDIGTWAYEEFKLKQALPEFRNKGYRVKVKKYRGLTYKYKLWMDDREQVLILDINLFRRYSDHAWCPQSHFKANPFRKNSTLYFIYGLPRVIIELINRQQSFVNIDKWPKSIINEVYTWWIPIQFYDKICFIDEGYPVPDSFDEYLKYRYGDWKTPRNDWLYIRDDGAIKDVEPALLINDFNNLYKMI